MDTIGNVSVEYNSGDKYYIERTDSAHSLPFDESDVRDLKAALRMIEIAVAESAPVPGYKKNYGLPQENPIEADRETYAKLAEWAKSSSLARPSPSG